MKAIKPHLIIENIRFPHSNLILGHRAEIHLTPDEFYDPQQAAELYEQAAELATTSMKGKTAAIFYEKAELAWSLLQSND